MTMLLCRNRALHVLFEIIRSLVSDDKDINRISANLSLLEIEIREMTQQVRE